MPPRHGRTKNVPIQLCHAHAHAHAGQGTTPLDRASRPPGGPYSSRADAGIS